ncbi:type IV pilus twitching motility protein PilT [Caldanaerobius polysaccharolyticus]|uniref:type IV pilus twitching motility protein PilT n=1 Tax=Caldanaerobius polysaccharolyticus TaxID=44256 RepID=UPI00047DBE11|nr:type IV pilus twitching motility protein PilT [Caldanaerobius polysaccharolyticus]
MVAITDLLVEAVQRKASDIHITVGMPPVLRINGNLVRTDYPAVKPEDTESFVQQLMSNEQYGILKQRGEFDFSYSLHGVGRFRINAYKQRGTFSLAIRALALNVPSIDELGLPAIVKDLAMKTRGLILVTGPTGSGKSTTLAAMIDLINSNRECHILTLEDPIEYLHKHKRSIVNQREIGYDSASFASALRAALREDPDVILVGEMRDLESMQIALTAAETGHLVLSTLHTIGAAKTIDRIVDVFPPHQQQQIRVQLSMVLEGVISQQLLRSADGKRRVLATEIMVATPAIRNLIREGKTFQIQSSVQTGARYGMHTMDSSIANLYRNGIITLEEAQMYAIEPENMLMLVDRR